MCGPFFIGVEPKREGTLKASIPMPRLTEKGTGG